jgi:hypothetical protein
MYYRIVAEARPHRWETNKRRDFAVEPTVLAVANTRDIAVAIIDALVKYHEEDPWLGTGREVQYLSVRDMRTEQCVLCVEVGV